MEPAPHVEKDSLQLMTGNRGKKDFKPNKKRGYVKRQNPGSSGEAKEHGCVDETVDKLKAVLSDCPFKCRNEKKTSKETWEKAVKALVNAKVLRSHDPKAIHSLQTLVKGKMTDYNMMCEKDKTGAEPDEPISEKDLLLRDLWEIKKKQPDLEENDAVEKGKARATRNALLTNWCAYWEHQKARARVRSLRHVHGRRGRFGRTSCQQNCDPKLGL